MTCQIISDKIYSIDDKYESVAFVEPGEEFVVNVQNAFGQSFQSLDEFNAFLANDELKKSVNHPCTGPIEVKTDQKNISLAITIVDAKVHAGYQCISKSTGFLKNRFPERSCTIFNFEDSYRLPYNNDLFIKTHPKIGFISTFDDVVRSPGRACHNGGNIDLNYLDKGSVIFLPVNSERARFAIGDMHVCQGNGEAAGIAVEADGEVTLRVDIVDKINFPLIRDTRRMIIIGWGDDLNKALHTSVENAHEYLKRVFPFCHWDDMDIYKFISAEGNMVLGNSTGKVITCGMVFEVPRLLNKYEFPIFG